MKKAIYIYIFIGSVIFMVLPLVSHAIKLEYPFGGLNDSSTPCDYINALYIWGLGIAGATAVTGMAIGGIYYMVGQNSRGKDRITNSLIGLLVLFGVWLILYTINPDLATFKNNCKLEAIPPPATTSPTATTPSTVPPSGSLKFQTDSIKAQYDRGEASTQLASLLNCMAGKMPGDVGYISSISDDKIAAGTCSFTSWSPKPSCSHGKYSCHYGGRTCAGKSYAVDYGDEKNLEAIKKASNECDPKAWVYPESDHVHISVGKEYGCGCDT